MQPSITVSIQGQRASFHEIAAKAYYHQPVTLRYRESFEQVFDDLATGASQKIFVATSNSAHGVIEEVRQLRESYSLLNEGTYRLSIKQHLIGVPGARLSDINFVLSHPVALSQCDAFLRRNPAIVQRAYHDTAAAARHVQMLNDPTVAAIGSAAAARLHGLEIIQDSVQNDPNNVTEFNSFSLANNKMTL